jgi:hypothetical protein
MLRSTQARVLLVSYWMGARFKDNYTEPSLEMALTNLVPHDFMVSVDQH